MDDLFLQKVTASKVYRELKDKYSDEVLENPTHLYSLFALGFSTSDKNHHKGWWVLELVFQQKINLIEPFLDEFLSKIRTLKHQSSVRPATRICMFLAQSKNSSSLLSAEAKNKITEFCLDIMISNENVATKVYAARTLFEFGKAETWIWEELKSIFEQNYANESPAYKAAAREILKQIN